MARTLAQLLTEVRQIVGQEDATKSNFTDSQLTEWLNVAYRRAVTELRVFPQVSTDYTPTSGTVTLDTGTITVDRARFKAQPANEFQELEILTYDEFIRRYPDYENDDTGIPTRLVRRTVTSAILHPAPNAANSGQTMRTFGLSIPTALSASSDTPTSLTDNLHDALPHFAAFRAFQFLERANDSTQQLILFNQSLKGQRQVSQGASRAKRQFWFSETDMSGDVWW